jgi:pyruvate kinase
MPHVRQHLSLKRPALSIICTAGPSVYTTKTVRGRCQTSKSLFPQLLEAGMRMVRINFSHVQPRQYEETKCLISHIRDLEKAKKQPIPILMDLKGPEIRIESILDSNLKRLKFLEIKQGKRLEISSKADREKPLCRGAQHRLVVNFGGDLYSQMVDKEAVVVGDNELYLRIVERVAGGVLCLTENPGTLKTNRGLNLPDRARLEGPVLGEEDQRALREGFDVDLIAQSFVQDHQDVAAMHGFLNGTPLRDKPIIVKIETPSAVKNIKAILQTRGVFGIMVARGDLGVLVDFKKIPQLQEELINSANKLGKPVIVATQMLESMLERPKPWRPEVQDISTAIKEGADALMLSEETAVGRFPVETVKVMADVINENMPATEPGQYRDKFQGKYAIPNPSRPIDVLGFAICEVAEEARAPFILSYATSGVSATLISRFRPTVPVLAVTKKPETARGLCLPYNVYPVLVRDRRLPRQPQEFIRFLREIVAELGLGELIKLKALEGERVFLVGTQELREIVSGGKAQGIFVFEP